MCCGVVLYYRAKNGTTYGHILPYVRRWSKRLVRVRSCYELSMALGILTIGSSVAQQSKINFIQERDLICSMYVIAIFREDIYPNMSLPFVTQQISPAYWSL